MIATTNRDAGAAKRIDARTQTREVLHERRKLVVRLHKDGVPVMQIVELSGLSWSAVNATIKLYAAGGESALVPRPSGRSPGVGRALAEEQEAEVRRLIRVNRPLYYGLRRALWSRETVLQLVKDKFHVELSERGIGNYLIRWGITVGAKNEKPEVRCAPEVRLWLKTNYAAVKDRADREESDIYWINEPVRLDSRIWSQPSAGFMQITKMGEAGVATSAESRSFADDEGVELEGEIDTRNMATSEELDSPPQGVSRTQDFTKQYRLISATNNQGKLHWVIINSSFTEAQKTRFINALVRDTRKEKIVLIQNTKTMLRAWNTNIEDRNESGMVKVEIIPPANNPGHGGE